VELLIVIARNEVTKQSPVLILRLKSLLLFFLATRHTSANPPYRVADGWLRNRPTKDDIPNPLSGWQEPRGIGIILFPVVFIN